MKKPKGGRRITPEYVSELLNTDEVNSLGGEARREARRVSGDRVYYGRLTPAEDAVREEYTEVRLKEREYVDPEAVNAFVGDRNDDFDEYREAGAPVDVAVVYGDGDFADRLADVDRLCKEADVRAVTLFPDGRTTAYEDLKAVAAARLCLGVPGVRVAREEVGNKLTQTSLAYGANDLGFVDSEDEEGFDAELAAREAGFEPVDRADSEGYGV